MPAPVGVRDPFGPHGGDRFKFNFDRECEDEHKTPDYTSLKFGGITMDPMSAKTKPHG